MVDRCVRGRLAGAAIGLVAASLAAACSPDATSRLGTTGSLAPNSPPAGGGQADTAVAEIAILAGINGLREQAGVAPVARNPALDKAARGFAQYMAESGRYGHDADGRRAGDRAAAAGYDSCRLAENIGTIERGQGLSTAELTRYFVDGWRESRPHRAALLQASAIDTGIGVAKAPAAHRYYAVQLFGRPRAKEVRYALVNRLDQPVAFRRGGKADTLRPGMVVTVRSCRPNEIALDGIAGSGALLEPEDGVRYEIVAEGAVAKVVAKRME
jgi:uncharacterized protein YkwD